LIILSVKIFHNRQLMGEGAKLSLYLIKHHAVKTYERV
jgi:hypothetical protein